MKKKMQKAITMFLLTSVFFTYKMPVAVFAAAQTVPQTKPNIVARIKFDPKVDGFGFQNYTNSKHVWQDDMNAGDMIRMFGATAVCSKGNTAQNCVMKAAAREWMMQKLEAAGGGHCEGMAVTSLRLATNKVFKGKTKAPDFQANAPTTFNLKLNQVTENYIAYYWVTQTLQEVWSERSKSMRTSPVQVVNQLIDGFKAGRDTYPISFWKYENGKLGVGHSVTPFAVEDGGSFYKIHVYDNNYPGQTRFIIVEKAGKQNWKYITSSNPSEPPSAYAGNIDTKSIGVSPTSLRDKGCFKVPFAADGKGGACTPVKDIAVRQPKPAAPKKPVEYTAPKRPQKPTTPKKPLNYDVPVKPNAEFDDSYFYDGEMAEFSLNGNADMMVVDGEGYALGVDPSSSQFVDEIAYSEVVPQLGGRGLDLATYQVPYIYDAAPYTILISGKNNRREQNVDLSFSAPGFSIGFDGLLVDPNEVIAMTISPDGQQISYTSSADGETPEIYFAVDNDNRSSRFEIDGAQIKPGKTLTVNYNPQNNHYYFFDNDDDSDRYDVDYTVYNPDGTIWYYETDDIDVGNSDRYEMDFSNWNGTGAVGVRSDDEGDGFDDDEYVLQPMEDNDNDADDANDEGDDEDSDIDNDGILNAADPDDDNDGIPDAKDSDDDNDGLSDSEDPDNQDDDGDGIPDDKDTDDDNDGIPDDKDTDDDNDGVLDENEDGQYNEDGEEDEIVDDDDDDNDGIPDSKDPDDDNDGIPDGQDDDTTDDDGDGIPDDEDNDDDNDGIPDDKDDDDDNDGIADDKERGDEEYEPVNDDDDDDDGIPDDKDDDDDNDGIPDSKDEDTTDDDGDGIPDDKDTDDDNDGVPDDKDTDNDDGDTPDDDGKADDGDASDDSDGDGIADDKDNDDDNDGIPDDKDDDDDGDGTPDSQEGDNDLDNDGIPNDEDTDIDGDGIPNDKDPDDDNDGVPDDVDKDDDNDGTPDDEEDGDGGVMAVINSSNNSAAPRHLFKIGDLGLRNGRFGTHYFEWTGKNFKKVKFEGKKQSENS